MTKHEAAREIVRRKGECATVECNDCPLHEGIFECNTMFDAKRAEEWLAANTEYIDPSFHDELIKETTMPKYKIDPIPGKPAWFVPGIVCRVRDSVVFHWSETAALLAYNPNEEYHFSDTKGRGWRFAEPVEEWEPQEGEWIAKWFQDGEHFVITRYRKEATVIPANYARLQYPDGRVIDCACDVEELKGRTDWA